ncbi:hypothetical protein KKD61_04075 [Patescibacteria group bacterium]|nr:hypothetical protein [Patescibacteria group bacterium]
MNNIYKSLLESFKWARNNTLDLFDSAHKNNILDYLPNYKNDDRKNRDVLYQFQCIATTTNTRIRIIKKDSKQKFGLLVTPEKEYAKRDIPSSLVKQILLEQISEIELLLRSLDDYQPDVAFNLRSLIFHEYLHQGQLVVMFREAGVSFPEEFDKAWNLSGQT